MPRIRAIKIDTFLDEELAEASLGARFLLMGMWTLADKSGRLLDRPIRIKAQVVPYDDLDVTALLGELQDVGALLRYEVNGHRYIQILDGEGRGTWGQSPHGKERESEIPPPPENSSSSPGIPRKKPSQAGKEGFAQ